MELNGSKSTGQHRSIRVIPLGKVRDRVVVLAQADSERGRDKLVGLGGGRGSLQGKGCDEETARRYANSEAKIW